MPNNHAFSHEASDGARVHVRQWPATAIPARGIIHITHGLAEHSGRYAPLAATLTACGYHVYAHDQRGHGQTAQTPADLGHFGDSDGWELLVADLAGLVARERLAHPGLPLIVLGHSMGSLVTRAFLRAQSHNVNAAILSGSSGSVSPLVHAGKLIARLERLRLGKRGRSRMINSLSFDAFNKPFRPNRTAFDWLSRDAAAVDKYIADPLCGFIATTQTWIALLGGITGLAAFDAITRIRRDLPLYILSGALDPVTDAGQGAEKLARDFRDADFAGVTYRVWPGARHETLNEINRDEVIAELVAWLDQVR
ncbi:MAG: lysophospholipase [Blastocatellia bacterium]